MNPFKKPYVQYRGTYSRWHDWFPIAVIGILMLLAGMALIFVKVK